MVARITPASVKTSSETVAVSGTFSPSVARSLASETKRSRRRGARALATPLRFPELVSAGLAA